MQKLLFMVLMMAITIGYSFGQQKTHMHHKISHKHHKHFRKHHKHHNHMNLSVKKEDKIEDKSLKKKEDKIENNGMD